MKRLLLLLLLLPLFIACPRQKAPEPIVSPPVSVISVLITSVPENVEILFDDKIVSTPARFKVRSIDQLLTNNIKAAKNMTEAVEQRIKVYSEEEIEVILIFDSGLSKMANTLRLAKILVFDYGDSITFDFNKYEIKPAFIPLLAKQAYMLKKYFDGIDAYICGHSDSVGRHDYNLELSLNRAKSVYDELIKLGVRGANMRVQGFGSNYPLASNDNEAGRAQNRRIEIILGR